MTRSQRLALMAAAAALLVGGFFVAKGSDSDTVTTSQGAPAATAVAPETTTTEAAGPADSASGTTPATGTTAPPKPVAPAIPAITIKDGKPEGGVKDLSFDKGDRVRFTVRSDVKDHVHVHGFDVLKDIEAGGKVTFDFKADIDGIFEVELEDAGEQIASLKVSP